MPPSGGTEFHFPTCDKDGQPGRRVSGAHATDGAQPHHPGTATTPRARPSRPSRHPNPELGASQRHTHTPPGRCDNTQRKPASLCRRGHPITETQAARHNARVAPQRHTCTPPGRCDHTRQHTLRHHARRGPGAAPAAEPATSAQHDAIRQVGDPIKMARCRKKVVWLVIALITSSNGTTNTFVRHDSEKVSIA